MSATAQMPLLSQIWINELSVSGRPGFDARVADELDRLQSRQADDAAQQALKEAVEALSDGANTVIYDDAGLPAVMVRVNAECAGAALPLLSVGGRPVREIWVSKYLNARLSEGAASLPMMPPLRVADFGEALRLCRAKGRGWTLMPFALRMGIARGCLRAGHLPGGNTDNGREWGNPNAWGIAVGNGTVLTGSGPASWSHDGGASGIWDLCGNLNEWDGGLRLLDGEIQLMTLEDLLNPGEDCGHDAQSWRALDSQGRLVAPGTAGTLRYEVDSGGIRLTNHPADGGIGNCAFDDIETEPGLRVPEIACAMGLCPEPGAGRGATGWRWVNTQGEALPLSGGAYRVVDHAGVFFVGITKARVVDYPLAGVRSVWVDPSDWERTGA